MAISEGNTIVASDIYSRQGLVVVAASQKATINIGTSYTYTMIPQMSTASNSCGICLIYYDSSWKAQWVYQQGSISTQITLTFNTLTSGNISQPMLTIQNNNSGVAVRCLFFSASPSSWSIRTSTTETTSGKRTDLTCAQPGEIIYPNLLTNTRHTRDIGASSSYTIALANYAKMPIFYFAKMGSQNYHQTGFFWYITSDNQWHHQKMSSQDRTNNPTLPTITISGTNVTITAASMDCRFSWFQVM